MNREMESSSSFNIGQIVLHQRFGYRGVIYDIDSHFMLSDEWYEHVAQSRPPKDRPWYYLLVDGLDQTTYVAERNLVTTRDRSPIEHPLIETYFALFNENSYESLGLRN
jgi:heat shock protein HspQ